MGNINRSIAEAEGYAALGMWQEAWDALEELPPEARILPNVLAVRLVICAGLPRFELGREIAHALGRFSGIHSEYSLKYREAAGRFHLMDALALCAAGDTSSARAAVESLSVIWPEGRMLALHSIALEMIW